MLTDYRNLPYPINLWSAVFQKTVSTSDLPTNWEAALDYVLNALNNEKREGAVRLYFQNRLPLGKIGEKQGTTLERARQHIMEAIREMQRPANRIILSYGLDQGKKLLEEKRTNALIADNEPVDILGLSVRANNCLRRAKIYTIGQLRRCNETDLLNIRNLGKSTLQEIEGCLETLIRTEPAEAAPVTSVKARANTCRVLRMLLDENLCAHETCKYCEHSGSARDCSAHRKESLINRMLEANLLISQTARWEDLLELEFSSRAPSAKRCSACGWTNPCKTNFCPNCGAKMF